MPSPKGSDSSHEGVFATSPKIYEKNSRRSPRGIPLSDRSNSVESPRNARLRANSSEEAMGLRSKRPFSAAPPRGNLTDRRRSRSNPRSNTQTHDYSA